MTTITFKPMIETDRGAKYNFIQVAAMNAETAEDLAKQMLVHEGHTIPVKPVLEPVPDEPKAEKKTYYGLRFNWENTSSHECPRVAFELQEDAQRFVDAAMAAQGAVLARDYGGGIDKYAKVFQGVGVETFTVSQYTDEQNQIMRDIKNVKDRNEVIAKDYKNSCVELEKTRKWIGEQRDKASTTLYYLDRLCKIFVSTNEIVEDASKTMELINKNHRGDLMAIIDQIVGGEESLGKNEQDGIDTFMPQLAVFIQERATPKV